MSSFHEDTLSNELPLAAPGCEAHEIDLLDGARLMINLTDEGVIVDVYEQDSLEGPVATLCNTYDEFADLIKHLDAGR